MISYTRYLIVVQFHSAEVEPEPIDDTSRIEIQMRRRAFWVAYGLDRLACGVLRIPLSIADDNITVPTIATEASLVESANSDAGRIITRITKDAADDIRSKLANVKSMVLNREIIRMVREMITEDLPEDADKTPTEAFQISVKRSIWNLHFQATATVHYHISS
ncbi:hypothetical protein TSTA_021640 [Talaromyces stipitatus ATCC 10500]|uniref:Xylanolytic transcriptional activator regulatory domain-containing protein n=1 Tax=Talaromyces stipitatus (strain ATCC 10500 / CBS 375.48 / QM 6759 / NRRL 1006) TaxID=441959 RepID=B8MHC8_TALSN|nr:uncharacterized protein TSTA_021640 [Talaromyces stipitatus ATCC 10500]EED17107.1 hypothetical protein TSTA_021640 [Talaromyces stipitatus ATCC 10500]